MHKFKYQHYEYQHTKEEYIFKRIFFFVNYGDMKLGQLIKFAWCEGVGPKSKPLVINEPIAINPLQPSVVFKICIANQMTVFYMEY